MKLELTEEQTIEIIKKYYEESKGIKVNAELSYARDDSNKQRVVIKTSNTLNIAGMNLKVDGEIDNIDLLEIFNSYLSADYNIKNVSFGTHREYLPRQDYYDRIKTIVELEPVNQKTKGRHI
jgi:hypothetical protein